MYRTFEGMPPAGSVQDSVRLALALILARNAGPVVKVEDEEMRVARMMGQV